MEIVCRDVAYRYEVPGAEWALRGVNLTIRQGEKIALVGPAGSGKTTLIQLLDALVLPTQGDVSFDQVSVFRLAKARKLASLRRRIGVLFQFPEHQFFQETAYDELAFALRNFLNPPQAEIERQACALLAPLGMDLEHLRHTSPFNLSSGEKRKLALASALMMQPELLILDEPTAGMDAVGRLELMRIIAGLTRTTVIVVTHNLEDFLPIIDRVVGLAKGALVIDLPREAIIDHLGNMVDAGIVPPLALSVQGWLREAGLCLPGVYFDMEALVAALREAAPDG